MADAAQEVAAALIQEDVVAPDTGEQPAEPTIEEPVVEQEVPSFQADTTGIEELLTEPDEEPDPYVYTPEPVQQSDEYEDPELRAVKEQLARANAQIEHERQLRAQNEAKRWAEEAERRFPLADVSTIQAQSRRSFLREAKASHERYEQKLGPYLEKLDNLREEVITEARQEGRQQAEAAWGRPTSAPQTPTVTAAETEVTLDRKNYKNPLDLIRARMAHDPQFKDGI